MIDIYQTGYGWISPRGNVLGCRPFNHVEALHGWEDVYDLARNAADELDSVEIVRQGCEALIAQDEHPEWHTYEMALDGATPEIIGCVRNAGFIRIGVSHHEQTIEAEGKPEAILSRMSVIRRIVREYNATNGKDYRLRAHSIPPRGVSV